MMTVYNDNIGQQNCNAGDYILPLSAVDSSQRSYEDIDRDIQNNLIVFDRLKQVN
jgi:hypothetical protein